jgi:hypothetical protein
MRKDAAVCGRLAVGFRLRVLMTSTQPSAVAREHSRAFERSAQPWRPRAAPEEAALSVGGN